MKTTSFVRMATAAHYVQSLLRSDCHRVIQPALFMSASRVNRGGEVRISCGILLRPTIVQTALDLASAVATHLDAVGTASRQADSPFSLSTYCWDWRPSSGSASSPF